MLALSLFAAFLVILAPSPDGRRARRIMTTQRDLPSPMRRRRRAGRIVGEK